MNKYSLARKRKYYELLTCEGCGITHLDDESCPNLCVECDGCNEMTKLSDLDEVLLLEAEAEICRTCAGKFLYELKEAKEGKVIMGDYKGRI